MVFTIAVLIIVIFATRGLCRFQYRLPQQEQPPCEEPLRRRCNTGVDAPQPQNDIPRADEALPQEGVVPQEAEQAAAVQDPVVPQAQSQELVCVS